MYSSSRYRPYSFFSEILTRISKLVNFVPSFQQNAFLLHCDRAISCTSNSFSVAPFSRYKVFVFSLPIDQNRFCVDFQFYVVFYSSSVLLN